MDAHLDALLRSLESKNGLERKQARETLVLVGEPALPHLLALLSSPKKQLRWEAAKALQAMVQPEILDQLVKLLSDPDSDIRWLAASGLIALGPRSAVPVLQSLLGSPPPRGQKEMSHRVLWELSAENGVLAGIVAPVVQALEADDPTPIPAKAERALSEIHRLTGRTPSQVP